MPHAWKFAFREFLDAMPVPAYLFDPESKHFVAANPCFCELVGYPEPELAQLQLPSIMADEGETARANEEISDRKEDVMDLWASRCSERQSLKSACASASVAS